MCLDESTIGHAFAQGRRKGGCKRVQKKALFDMSKKRKRRRKNKKKKREKRGDIFFERVLYTFTLLGTLAFAPRLYVYRRIFEVGDER